MVGWENLTPERLAQDIAKYQSQGNSLEDIKTGALSQGVTEVLWNQAVSLLPAQQIGSPADASAPQQENSVSPTLTSSAGQEEQAAPGASLSIASSLSASKSKKLLKIVTACVLVLLIIALGLFGYFHKEGEIPFTSIKKKKELVVEVRERPAVEEKVETKEEPKTAGDVGAEPVKKEEIPAQEKPAMPKETQPELPIADLLFKEQVGSGEITVDFFDPDGDPFQDFTSLEAWIKEKLPTATEVESVQFSFTANGTVKENSAKFFDQGLDKTLAVNTRYPFRLPHRVMYSTKGNQSGRETAVYTDWQAMFEKINFAERPKENLTLSIEVYPEGDKKFVKIDFVYPDKTKNASIEVDFLEFKDILEKSKIAFGRRPKVSTGFFAEKYPIRTGPRPNIKPEPVVEVKTEKKVEEVIETTSEPETATEEKKEEVKTEAPENTEEQKVIDEIGGRITSAEEVQQSLEQAE